MIGLPGVQRVRRLQDGAVALDHLDLARDRRDDPVADLVEHEEGVVRLVVVGFRPDDARRARLDEFHLDDRPAGLLAQRARGDIVHVQPAAGVLGADVAFGEREDGAPRDDEEAPQLREPRDDVVGEAIRRAAAAAPLVRRLRQTA